MRNFALAILAVSLLGAAAVAAAPGAWPQWRGANRDATADGTRLLDNWPKDGPKLLWKSAELPSREDGGSGSVVVADGKAVVYLNWAHFSPKRLITAEYVKSWGWADAMPDDLVKKVEAARMSEERKKSNAPAAAAAFAKDFIGKLDAAEAAKFAAAIEVRLKRGPNAWSWETMQRLAANVDRELNSEKDVWAVFKATNVHHNDLLQGQITDLVHSAQTIADAVVCLDASNGKTLWKMEEPGIYAQMWGAYFPASGTPAISGGKVYATGAQSLSCRSLSDGALFWKTPIRYSNSSPLVTDGKVFVLATPSTKPVTNMGGDLCAYDAATGALVWRQPRVASNWGASPVPWSSGAKACLIANADGGVFCVGMEKGEILWQAPGGGSTTAAVRGDTMVVHGAQKIRGYKLSPEKAEVTWERPVHGDRMGSPVVYNDLVFFDGAYQDGFGCIDLKTGKDKWVRMQEVGHCSSPIVADGKVFAIFAAASGQPENSESIRMFNATGEGFQELGRFNPNVAYCTTPTIAGGRMYLRCVDCVGCWEVKIPNSIP